MLLGLLVGAGVEATEFTEEAAGVELRVWQSVRDPHRVFLSARPSGGAWGATEQLPLGQTNARKTFRYSDRTMVVPVGPVAVGVNLRVWQSMHQPLRVYLSVRPPGGEWGRAEQLPLGQTNARETFRFSDRTVAVPWPEQLVEDATALLEWRDTLAGTATLNWSGGRAVSSWSGVTVAGTPRRVTKLELANRGLTGELSGLSGELTGLTELRLDGNALTGRIPSKVVLLTGLTHVYLGGNALTGCLPRSLRAAANNDLATLGLADCGPPVDVSHPRGYEAGALTAGTYQFTTGKHAPRLVFDVPDGLKLTIIGAALKDPESVSIPALTLREAGGRSWIALDFQLGQTVRRWAEEQAVASLFDRIGESLWLTAPSSATPSPGEESVSSLPSDLPAFTFVGEISGAQQAEIPERMAGIMAFYEDRYGVRVPGLRAYVGDIETLLDVTEDVLGSAAVVDGGMYSAGTIFLRTDAVSALEHEYFHAVQDQLASGHDWGPWWLTEGAAQHASWLYREARGDASYADSLAFARWVSTFGDELQSMQDEPDIVFPSAYEFMALAVHWLVAQGGEGSVMAYFRALPTSDSWQDAFRSAFAIEFEDVYGAFGDYLSTFAVARRNVEGSITRTDGGSLSQWRFHLEAFLPGSQRQWDLREGSSVASGSRFRMEIPDGQYEISVGVYCGPYPVDLGWYGGESGFTTAYDEVTYLAVEGVDVSGVAIALPEDPSAYHELCDPRPVHRVSGVVSDSSGDPLPGFEVTAYNVTSNSPVYGPTITHNADTTFIAEDGTFILEVPDGSYDVRVYERCGRLLGSYDIQLDSFHDPFSGPRVQWVENLVVVQGEDITGIEFVIPDRPGALEGLTLREWLATRGADCSQP